MSAILPSGRPRLDRNAVAQLLHKAKVTTAVAIVSIRGYLRDSMGKPGANDRVIYDALFVVSPDAFVAFNGNVDPSAYRKGIAVL